MGEQNDNFRLVLQSMNGTFERINSLLCENERVLLMKVAQDVEFLDSEEGMSRMEFNRFVDRIPSRLHTKFESLLEQPRYCKLKSIFDDDPKAKISAKQIQTLIDDLTEQQSE